MIETCNFDSRQVHNNFAGWNLWNVDHKYYFSPATLFQLMHQAGLVELQLLTVPETPVLTTLATQSNSPLRLGLLLRHPLKTIKGRAQGLRERLIARRFPGVEHDYLITMIGRKQSYCMLP